MKHMVHSVAAAAAISITSLVGSAAPTQAYSVDCAILLCLAGGWPASAACAHARAVFIRRITPWPIEPPLQIWRCPMRASFSEPAPVSPIDRLYNIALRDPPLVHSEAVPGPLVRVQADDQADIDISDGAFGFVRSIRVYHIQFGQRQIPDGDCDRSDATRLGTYGLQGDYRWTRSNAAQVPTASQLIIPNDCGSYFYRSVFVDWRDHAGNYGFEEVRY